MYARLYCPCKIYVLCYRTLIWLCNQTGGFGNAKTWPEHGGTRPGIVLPTPAHLVHVWIWITGNLLCTAISQVYTPLEGSGQVGSFPVAFAFLCTDIAVHSISMYRHWHTRFRHVFEEKLQERYSPALTLLRRYKPVWTQSELSTYRKSY